MTRIEFQPAFPPQYAPSVKGSTAVTVDGLQVLSNKVLIEPIISTIDNGGLLTLPTVTTTLIGNDTEDVILNKDLTDASNLFPSTFVETDAIQTLSNKTLANPTISTITNVGTLTLPTVTGTLALVQDITSTQLSVTNKRLENTSPVLFSTSNPFNSNTLTCLFPHGLEIGDVIGFSAVGALTGVSPNTPYTVSGVDVVNRRFSLAGVTLGGNTSNNSGITYYIISKASGQGVIKFSDPNNPDNFLSFDLSACQTPPVLRFTNVTGANAWSFNVNGGEIPNTINSQTIRAPAWTFTGGIYSTRIGTITATNSGLLRNPDTTTITTTTASDYYFTYFTAPTITSSIWATGDCSTIRIQGAPTAGGGPRYSLRIDSGDIMMANGILRSSTQLNTISNSVIVAPAVNSASGAAALQITPSTGGWSAGGTASVVLGDQNHILSAQQGVGMTARSDIGFRIGNLGSFSRHVVHGTSSYSTSLNATSSVTLPSIPFGNTLPSVPFVVVSLNTTSDTNFWAQCLCVVTSVTQTGFVVTLTNTSASATTGSVNICYVAYCI